VVPPGASGVHRRIGALAMTRAEGADIRPVLLCYDGSEHAEHAIRLAGSLLSVRSALVCHVGGGGKAATVAESGRRVALDAGFDPVSVVDGATGPVAEAILTQAAAAGVAAIVVGSRGRSGSGATILGSVSSRLAHHAQQPLLVVRPGSDGEALQGPVFVCFDASEGARHAIATAGALLAGHDAIVAYFLPTVDDAVLLRTRLPWPRSAPTQEELAALDRQEAVRPGEVAAHGVDLAERAGLTARGLSLVDEGAAWDRLSEAAAAERASCIVVGHRCSEGGLSHLGSTAYGLVHHANRPVLVAPMPQHR
jgi:nucleotide-binding universal stress UspA family protein